MKALIVALQERAKATEPKKGKEHFKHALLAKLAEAKALIKEMGEAKPKETN